MSRDEAERGTESSAEPSQPVIMAVQNRLTRLAKAKASNVSGTGPGVRGSEQFEERSVAAAMLFSGV
ncbi:hypothetical protein [Dactylosporangium sp. NPDC049140]|uniref:hypothetical protein n=1 Tax=Dactylosporangium sp. NPDC049140 TaxID=3155647 RepID=UPI0034041B5C